MFRVSASPGIQDTQLDCPYPPHSVNAQTFPVPSSPGQPPLPSSHPAAKAGLAGLQAPPDNTQEQSILWALCRAWARWEAVSVLLPRTSAAPVPGCMQKPQCQPVFSFILQSRLILGSFSSPSLSMTASILVLFFACLLALVCCCITSVVSDSVRPIDGSPQAPPFMGFSRQEYWSGLLHWFREVLLNWRAEEPAFSFILQNLLFGAQNYLLGSASAAAAKSLQSCPTLCDPKDGSPPGSPVSGILQARTLE